MNQSPEDLKQIILEQQARLRAFEASAEDEQARQQSLEAAAEPSAVSAALADTLAAFVTQPGDYVTAHLGGLNCRHFVSGGLDERPAAPTAATQVPVQEPLQLPGETLGTALIRRVTAPQPERGDPRIDPSQPLPLGARSLTRR